MNIVRSSLIALFAWLAFSLAFASHFTGTYQDQQGGVTLIIQHSTNTQMQGLFIGQGGMQMQLQGRGDENGAQGMLISPQGQLSFQAQLSPDMTTLQFTIFQAGPGNQGAPGGGQQLVLRRVSNDARLPTPQPPAPQPPTPPGPPGPQPPVPPQPPSQPGGGNPLDPGGQGTTPSTGSWDSVYSGNGGQLTLVIQQAPSGYSGYIELSGSRYPFEAQGDESYLEGVFQSPNGQYEFFLERDEAYVYLYSGDTEYVLTRQVAPTPTSPNGGNPLGNP